VTAGPATLAETLTIYVAKQLRDDDVGFTGMVNGDASAMFGSAIPLAAMYHAQLTHAPNLTLLLAGWLTNPDISKLETMPDSEFKASLRDLDADALINAYPAQYRLRRGDITVGFSNGAQVDAYGNMNSVCIGPHDHPKVRLVGPIFQTEHLAFFGREIIMMPHHDRRNFVEKVDFVSAVGYPGGVAGRRELGLDVGSGPALVITPLCVFDFDLESGRMRVKSVHDGVDPAEVRASTGFELGDLSDVPVTPAPGPEDLEILRTRVDPRGIMLSNANPGEAR
jgi:glutaconate CoA-transferase, subunit B